MTILKKASQFISLAFFFLCLSAPFHRACATDVNDKLWLAFVAVKPFSQDKTWHYLFYTSMRFIDQSHPWQMTLIEGGIGHTIYPKQTLWAGYRWSGNNFNNNFFQLNMLWQQWISEAKNDRGYRVLIRSRLQETLRSNASPVAFVLRERLMFVSPHTYYNHINPVFYDEGFFSLNETPFTSRQTFNENRLFLGFNYVLDKNTYWEIGYINQYQFNTPLIQRNLMSHILTVTYLII